MRCAIPLILVLVTMAMPVMAQTGAPRVAVELGASALRLQGEPERAWGTSLGATAAIGLMSHARLQLHGALARFPGRDDRLRMEMVAVTLVYDLDLVDIRPFIGAGLGISWVSNRSVSGYRETTATLEAGVDIRSLGWLLWGVTVRYVPLFDSALLGQPAYATVNARIGAEWSLLGGD